MPERHNGSSMSPRSLASIVLLRSLLPAALTRLAADCRWQSAERGQEIVGRGIASGEVYFVAAGRVRVTAFAASGREVAFRDLGQGSTFGQISAIDGQARSASVVALETSVIASVSRERFLNLLRDHPSLAFALLQDFAALIRDLTSRLVDTTTLTTPMRLRAELLRMARDAGIDKNRALIPTPPTHFELASRIGATREAVTRELNRLARGGIIKREGKMLAVLDIALLQSQVLDE